MRCQEVHSGSQRRRHLAATGRWAAKSPTLTTHLTESSGVTLLDVSTVPSPLTRITVGAHSHGVGAGRGTPGLGYPLCSCGQRTHTRVSWTDVQSIPSVGNWSEVMEIMESATTPLTLNTPPQEALPQPCPLPRDWRGVGVGSSVGGNTLKVWCAWPHMTWPHPSRGDLDSRLLPYREISSPPVGLQQSL